MAKLKAPLLSLGASGAIGKSLVFFPWKGIDAVREYVVPANPKSDNQITQRGHLTFSVLEWHLGMFTAADVIAWNKLAGVAAAIMSGFNRMIQEVMIERALTNVWTRLRDVTTSVVFSTGFDPHVEKVSGGIKPVVHYGTRKTHFPDSLQLVDYGEDHWSNSITGLKANTLYYFYIDVGTTKVDYGRTGIYQQRTLPE